MKDDSISFETILTETNLVPFLSEDKLMEIAQQCTYGLTLDRDSRKEKLERFEKAMKLAKQVPEEKTTPWEGAANNKDPLISKAAIEYASRTWNEVIRGDDIVQEKVFFSDPAQKKFERGTRLKNFLNHHLLYKQRDYKKGLDKAFHMLPMCGTVFRKIGWDEIKRQIKVETCNYRHLIINENVMSLEDAPRISHLMPKTRQSILTNIKFGRYADIDLDDLEKLNTDLPQEELDEITLQDDQGSIWLVEQACYLDLDGDSYPEPYLVTFHESSSQVFRIVRNFKETAIHYADDEKTEIAHIEPTKRYVDYHCILDPAGGFWSLGFGILLYNANNMINSLQNQLVDAGTLSNRQSGFVSRRLRMKSGATKVKPGEFIPVDNPSGSSLADSFYPLPAKDPSPVLFQLLGLVMESARSFASITDVLQGTQNGTNVPTGTAAILEKQGLVTYSAMQKRLFYSLDEELRVIMDILQENITPQEYMEVVGKNIIPGKNERGEEIVLDFSSKDATVIPVFDPTAASDTQRLMKIQTLMQFAQQGVIDVAKAAKVTEKLLQLQDLGLAMTPQPKPSADDILKQAKAEEVKARTAKILGELQNGQINVQEAMARISQIQQQNNESQARVLKMAADAVHDQHQAGINQQNNEMDHKAQMAKIVGDSTDKLLKLHEIEKKHEAEANKLGASPKVAKEPSN